MNPTQIKIIRGSRKTLSLQIKEDAVLVKAPRQATDEEIQSFLQKHRRWIETHLRLAQEQTVQAQREGRLTMEELQQLADEALQVIPKRVRFYAPLMDVTYGRITIRNQRTRWGSCSSKGNLNFNCLLMLCPPEVIDSVVVHELAHRKEMNHSQRFYSEVQRVFPDYWKWDRWLKEHGPSLMKRMTGTA